MTVVPPGGGEVIGDAPDRRVEILSDDPAINATLSRFGPGREGADLHVHRRHSDLFYVLEGELTVRLGVEDRLVTAPAVRLRPVRPARGRRAPAERGGDRPAAGAHRRAHAGRAPGLAG